MSFIINLFGPSTVGKSTTAAGLQHSIDGLDVIDFDTIKRQIPQYDWTKHAQEGRSITLDKLRLDSLTEDKILLLMPSPKDKDEYEFVDAIAKARGSRLINVQLTAPDEVLIYRYRDRLANIDPQKKDWKFKTLDEFEAKLREEYYVPDNTTAFDTSHISTEAIVEKILKLTK